MPTQLRKENLSKQIFEDLVRRIRSKNIKSGDRLVVRKLQEEYNVSSTPVRDALSLLYRYGFVELGKNSRMTVISMDEKKVMDLMDLMEVNMITSAQFCFRYNKRQAYQGIKAACDAALACRETGTVHAAALQAEVINAFADHCGNVAFARMVDPLLGCYAVFFGDYQGILGTKQGKEECKAILQGFELDNCELVCNALLRLVGRMRE